MMSVVTVSPKFQVVIPKEVRKSLRLQPGQKLLVMATGTGISLVPDVGAAALRGISRDLPDDFVREKQDRDIG
jgi:AbrB family looped-hinge helix DNA binding protein